MGDEKHLVFEYTAMQHVRHEYAELCEGPQGTAKILLMRQDNLIGIALFINACFKSGIYQCLLSLQLGARHLISPELARRDVKDPSFHHHGIRCFGNGNAGCFWASQHGPVEVEFLPH